MTHWLADDRLDEEVSVDQDDDDDDDEKHHRLFHFARHVHRSAVVAAGIAAVTHLPKITDDKSWIMTTMAKILDDQIFYVLNYCSLLIMKVPKVESLLLGGIVELAATLAQSHDVL